MLYKICNNERAVLITRELQMLDESLFVEFEGIEDGFTAVIKNGEGVYYRPISNGSAVLMADLIKTGVIQIAVVKNDETKPRWICDELYAIAKYGNVAIAGNTLEYDKILAELRIENDEFRTRMMEYEKELKSLRQHYEEIYAGYEQL